MAVGIAAALAAVQPTTLQELLFSVSGGVVGSLISDIDIGTSESHRDADKITLLTISVISVFIALDYFFHTDIITKIITQNSHSKLLFGILLFIGICAFGKEQPHRSFMHSFFALLLLNFALSLVYGEIVPYFSVGFLSHLALDVLNKKRLRLLYPLNWGISFNFFSSRGFANKVFFILGNVVTALELLRFGTRFLLS